MGRRSSGNPASAERVMSNDRGGFASDGGPALPTGRIELRGVLGGVAVLATPESVPMAASNDDWRQDLPHKDYLHGLEFHRARYVQPSPDWDHDHCHFCWQRFAEP